MACPSPPDCLAVGDYDFAVADLPFADLWTGGQWRLLTIPGG